MNAKELRESLQELRQDPEGRKAATALLLGVLLWCFGGGIWLQASAQQAQALQVRRDLRELTDLAAQALCLPVGGAAAAPEDPLSALTQTVESMKLKDRMVQLASNPAGAVVQLDGLYGEECTALAQELIRRGLTVRTAELKALPFQKDRLLSVTLVVGGNKP
ncbi:type II secretion system protein GspM [Aminomonas paucivorans]|uniref:type II secretion system protein GspM n=1 Tax=Aminomonas paucivorans TaxID=81412 RepID=UPI00332F7C31